MILEIPFYKVERLKRKSKKRKTYGSEAESKQRLTYKTRANRSYGNDDRTSYTKSIKLIRKEKHLKRFKRNQPPVKKVKAVQIRIKSDAPKKPSPYDSIRSKPKTPTKTTIVKSVKSKVKATTKNVVKQKADWTKENVEKELYGWKKKGFLSDKQVEKYLKKLNGNTKWTNREIYRNAKRTAFRGHKFISRILDEFLSKGGSFDGDGNPISGSEGLIRFGNYIRDNYYNGDIETMMEDFYNIYPKYHKI